MAVEECLEILGVSTLCGLSNIEANSRIAQYGKNELVEPKKQTLMELILEQFKDKLVQVLLGVAVLSGTIAILEKDLKSIFEPILIFSILIMNAIIGAFQSLSAENSIDALKKLQPKTTQVLREGRWITDFPSNYLVPGDIIQLRVGDKVPADARIIKLLTNTFNTDEGSLTGESASVSKSIEAVEPDLALSLKSSMVFSGTLVTTGSCYAVIVRTGSKTEIGLINEGVQEAKLHHHKTPLAVKLDEFADRLTSLVGVICLLVFLVSIPKFSSPMFPNKLKAVIHYSKVAIALGVAAIPEALPTVVSLCLAMGTRKMAARNVIVRKLSSVETLGCASVICTDKTGTLTTNQMTVKSLVTFDISNSYEGNVFIDNNDENFDNEIYQSSNILIKDRQVEGVSYVPIGNIQDLTPNDMKFPGLQMLASIASVCNEARLDYKDNSFFPIGEPTEVSLRVFVEKLRAVDFPISYNPVDLANQFNNYWNSKYIKLSTLEFSRDRKSMSVLVRSNRSDNFSLENMLFVKGAAELVLERCTKLMLSNGNIVPITDSLRLHLEKKVSEMSKKPLRCLALAFKYGESLGELNHLKDPEETIKSYLLQNISNYRQIESDLILVGITGIKDPARPEVADSILKCKNAGIRVMMITGDSKDTAVAIAKEVNIFEPEENIEKNAFTGKEFFSLPANLQKQYLASGNKVFCRTEPKDKQKLVQILDQLGEIAAMTGDGVNDAPALQESHIGISMGITGTEVAKNAADLILADDNFSTIVNAIEEGRNIFSNMQTLTCFLISSNIGEILSILIATLLGIPEPLTSLHLMWINLATDGPPATALGYNPSDPQIMNKPPRSKNESLLTPWLLFRYLISGFYLAVATIGAFSWWFLDKGVSFHQLTHWNECFSWTNFAHSANAPNWPQNPCSIFSSESLRKPQTMALTVIVLIELLKAISAVSLDNSIFQIYPWKNPWLIKAVLAPMILQLAIIYVPFFNNIFGLSPLNWTEWTVSFHYISFD